jgi:hypothetical protein
MWLAAAGSYVFEFGGWHFRRALVLASGAASVLLAPFVVEGLYRVHAYLSGGLTEMGLNEMRLRVAAVAAFGFVAVLLGLYSFIEV